MKVLSANQIREADAYTIKHEPISSIDLMERAAQVCVEWLVAQFEKTFEFTVVCGPGNNGGDGLAIARLLRKAGYQTDVILMSNSKKSTSDYEINLSRLEKMGDVRCLSIEEGSVLDLVENGPNRVWVDAIFGSGLSRSITGFIGQVIQEINQSGLPIISIDIPSGLFSEDNTENKGYIINAHYTLSLQLPKLAFLFPDNGIHTGQWIVLPIGLDQTFIGEQETPYNYVTKSLVQGILIEREKFSHKGKYGHALLIAGSDGMMGAAVLAAKSCLRSGAGLLTTWVPGCGYEIMQGAVPEAMAVSDAENDHISGGHKVVKYNAIGVGPGMGMHEDTVKMLKHLIQDTSVPMVLDADAINIIAENKTWLSFIPKGSIYTPHPGEFKRLVGDHCAGFERLSKQIEFSIKYGVYVVLKGMHTSITLPDGSCYFNSTGNAGMATGGSGDVLTGIITGLIAQGYPKGQACVLGVYLHGLAGDIACSKLGMESMISGDIVSCLGDAFQQLIRA